MSNSYKKIAASSSVPSMKWWKRHMNKKFRMKAKSLLEDSDFEETLFPKYLKEVHNIWGTPVDGNWIAEGHYSKWEKNPKDPDIYYNNGPNYTKTGYFYLIRK